MISITVKCPKECSGIEIQALCALIQLSGEVAKRGLLERVKGAKALAFASDADDVIGVAALKRPHLNYRRRIFKIAKVEVDPEEVDNELGWVFVCQKHRGNGLSHELIEALLNSINYSIFATSKTNNIPMHKVLKRSDFYKTGEEYQSKEHPTETLTFFLRHRISN